MSDAVNAVREFMAARDEENLSANAAALHDGYLHARPVAGMSPMVSTCKRCGAALFPTLVTNVLALHDAWHADREAES